MIPAAVFDTNVLVAGFLSPTGPPGRFVEWLRGGVVQAVLDDRIFAEYREVLLRPAFGLPAKEVDEVLAAITRRARWVQPGIRHMTSTGLPDPDDAPFLECARAAEVPLVTGNLRHFPRSVTGDAPVLTPARFLERLGGELG